MITRRIIASARAIALAYGPEAGESFAQGWPGWTKYAEPDWWESVSPPNHELRDAIVASNFTRRVSVEGGPVLWEENS